MEEFWGLMLKEQQKQEITKIVSCNEKTERFGLSLNEENIKELIVNRKNTLKENRRVEFGEGILPDIIYAFCDSSYINQNNYVETLAGLQEIFYLYKNESLDELTDDELIDFMKNQFENVCYGDLDYLKETCLERFTRAVRMGYKSQMQQMPKDEYALRETINEYDKVDEEARWERELYWKRLEDFD